LKRGPSATLFPRDADPCRVGNFHVMEPNGGGGWCQLRRGAASRGVFGGNSENMFFVAIRNYLSLSFHEVGPFSNFGGVAISLFFALPLCVDFFTRFEESSFGPQMCPGRTRRAGSAVAIRDLFLLLVRSRLFADVNEISWCSRRGWSSKESASSGFPAN